MLYIVFCFVLPCFALLCFALPCLTPVPYNLPYTLPCLALPWFALLCLALHLALHFALHLALHLALPCLALPSLCPVLPCQCSALPFIALPVPCFSKYHTIPTSNPLLHQETSVLTCVPVGFHSSCAGVSGTNSGALMANPHGQSLACQINTSCFFFFLILGSSISGSRACVKNITAVTSSNRLSSSGV